MARRRGGSWAGDEGVTAALSSAPRGGGGVSFAFRAGGGGALGAAGWTAVDLLRRWTVSGGPGPRGSGGGRGAVCPRAWGLPTGGRGIFWRLAWDPESEGFRLSLCLRAAAFGAAAAGACGPSPVHDLERPIRPAVR